MKDLSPTSGASKETYSKWYAGAILCNATPVLWTNRWKWLGASGSSGTNGISDASGASGACGSNGANDASDASDTQ